MTLESILNVVIPWGIILIFIGLIYWKLKAPIDIMFKGLGRLFMRLWESISGSLESNPVREVTYK